mgnify:FL=1
MRLFCFAMVYKPWKQLENEWWDDFMWALGSLWEDFYFILFFASVPPPDVSDRSHQGVWQCKHIENTGIQPFPGSPTVLQIRFSWHFTHWTLSRGLIRREHSHCGYRQDNDNTMHIFHFVKLSEFAAFTCREAEKNKRAVRWQQHKAKPEIPTWPSCGAFHNLHNTLW